LKIGCQLIVYGEHRLVGDLDWSNNTRAFDAIKINYKGEAINVMQPNSGLQVPLMSLQLVMPTG
jgi:hypothetical protein